MSAVKNVNNKMATLTEEDALLFAIMNNFTSGDVKSNVYAVFDKENGRRKDISYATDKELCMAYIKRSSKYLGADVAKNLFNIYASEAGKYVKYEDRKGKYTAVPDVPSRYSAFKDYQTKPVVQQQEIKSANRRIIIDNITHSPITEHIALRDADFNYYKQKGIINETTEQDIVTGTEYGKVLEETLKSLIVIGELDASSAPEFEKAMFQFSQQEVAVHSEEISGAQAQLEEEEKAQEEEGVVNPEVQQEAQQVLSEASSDAQFVEPVDAGAEGSSEGGEGMGAGAGSGASTVGGETLYEPSIPESDHPSLAGAGMLIQPEAMSAYGDPTIVPTVFGGEVGEDEMVVPSVYIQSVSGLTATDNIKHFQKEALSIYFGSSKNPVWDPTLLTDRIRTWKDKPEMYKKDVALRENRSIAKKYGDEFLLNGTLENGLYNDEKSSTKDILIENEEILQLFFCYKRNMAKGPRIPTAQMNVNQLMAFRNELAGKTVIKVPPEGGNALGEPKPPSQSVPTQPVPVDTNIQLPAPPLYEQWRNRKHAQDGLMNPVPNAVRVGPTQMTTFKGPLDPQISTFYGKIPSQYKLKTDLEKEKCKITYKE